MRILKTATEVGTLVFAVPAMLGLLVARDVADEFRYQRWARKYRREHPETGHSDLRLTYVAQLRSSHGKRAASVEAAAGNLSHPARHA